MELEEYNFKDLLSRIVDNRGRTCPTATCGTALIATNCIKDDQLYPVFENVRWVDSETMNNWFRGHPEPGDILFVLKGSPGRCCLVPDPVNFCIAQDMLAIRADERIVSQKFLFALLRSRIVQTAIENLHVGTMIPHFKKGDFDKLIFQIPKSRNIQDKIGDIYFTLSNKIELNRRMNATLEGMAQTLFKSWFIDFDPVIDNVLVKNMVKYSDQNQPSPNLSQRERDDIFDGIPEEFMGRAEIRHQALADGTANRDAAKAFPAAFQQIEAMGWVPEGWKSRPLGEVADILNGYAFQSGDYTDTGIFVLRTKNFDENGLSSRRNDDVFLPHSFSISHEAYLSQPFDFHLVMVGASIGKTSLLLPHMLPALRNQNMWCFRPKVNFNSRTFLNLAVQKKVIEVIAWASGSARSFFRKSDFRNHKILVPSNHLLLAFENVAGPMFSSISTKSAESENLSKLRDMLLPKLISGELRVDDSERLIEEAKG